MSEKVFKGTKLGVTRKRYVLNTALTFLGNNDIHEHLGFNIGANNFVANTLISTNVINLQKETTLFIHSDMVNNGRDNVLQEIFGTSEQDYSTIVFQQQCLEGYSKLITSHSNNIYRFYLTDDDDRAIDLNGQNICLTLLVYKRNDTYELLKQFLKFQTLKS